MRWTVIGWLLIILAVCSFIVAIKAILLPFVIGILAAYLLDPLADRMQERGIGRGIASALIIVGFFSIIIAGAVALFPMLVKQSGNLVATLPGSWYAIQAEVDRLIHTYLYQIEPEQAEAIKDAAHELPQKLVSFTSGLFEQILQSGASLLNLASLLMLSPLVAFYLLRDWDKLKTEIDSYLPIQHADTIREQLHTIDRTLNGFIRGQLTVCFILAIYYTFGFSLVGLDFSLVLGLISGLLIILPYVGFIVSLILGMGIGFYQFGTGEELVWLAIIFGGAQLLESYFLTPKLVGESVGLHPLWIIFGMLAGGTLFGFVGVLIAVPLTAVIGVLFRFALQQYLQSPLYDRKIK